MSEPSEAAKKLVDAIRASRDIRGEADVIAQRALDAAADEVTAYWDNYITNEARPQAFAAGAAEAYERVAQAVRAVIMAPLMTTEAKRLRSSVEEAIRALAAPKQAEQPLVKVDPEGLKRLGLRVRIEAEQPDHEFVPQWDDVDHIKPCDHHIGGIRDSGYGPCGLPESAHRLAEGKR